MIKLYLLAWLHKSLTFLTVFKVPSQVVFLTPFRENLCRFRSLANISATRPLYGDGLDLLELLSADIEMEAIIFAVLACNRSERGP